mgnify:CR=1 FL=1
MRMEIRKKNLNWLNGTQNGIAISYFENGLIHTKGDCVNGKYNGIFYQLQKKEMLAHKLNIRMVNLQSHIILILHRMDL